MLRSTLVFAILAAASLTPALAQDFTAEQRAACKGDYETFCKGVAPGGGRVLACLSKESAKLSAACKKVVDAQKK
jgi:hypothetical protein